MRKEIDEKKYRGFIAFEIPKEIKDFCISAQKDLILQDVKAKWTPSGNHHLTINFLGNKSFEELTEINSRIKSLNINTKNILLTIDDINTFGHPPKVLFLKVIDPLKIGFQTVSLIEKINNIRSEHKNWIPHLTLARFRNINESRTLSKAEHSLHKNPKLEFTPTKITVFTSELSPVGPIYRNIENLCNDK
jgi:RNA 2',3'-cyclic 3'-phosphodiesterase